MTKNTEIRLRWQAFVRRSPLGPGPSRIALSQPQPLEWLALADYGKSRAPGSCAAMCSFHFRKRRFNLSLWTWLFVSVTAIVPPLTLSQSMKLPSSARVDGLVTDSWSNPLGGVTVTLQSATTSEALSAITDSKGQYSFSALEPGKYSVRAEKSGYAASNADNMILKQGEAKQIDLHLVVSLTAAQFPKSADSKTRPPDFFDEPKFTVAGVTEISHFGGHGSDAVRQNSESLTKAAASLSEANALSQSPSSSVVQSSPLDPAAEASLRQQVRAPGNYEANFKLGELLVQEGRYREALSFLEQASHLTPTDKSASRLADLHHLLGTANEGVGNPLPAVREYQRAAELYASERNLFDWGTELLVHRAFEPALEVFSKGSKRFPQSVRMRLGLSAAWYAGGSYDQAARTLCDASELNPRDPNPYVFMGRMQSLRGASCDCFSEKLARFAGLQPNNALAHYYYAVSLLKSRKNADDTEILRRVEALLNKSLELDPKLGDAYLQLGILSAEHKNFPQAISYYQKSIALGPQDEEAHYRLAQAYERMGENSKAHQEFEIYEKVKNQQEEAAERELHEIRRFVYTLKGAAAPTRQ